MTESDSTRLARMEEKFDALADKIDERHENTKRRLECVEIDTAALKQDRAKVVGAAVVAGGALGAIGSLVLKVIPWGGR